MMMMMMMMMSKPLPHFFSIIQITLLIFLLSVSSRSNNLATIRIECGVLQSTKKIMQWWSMPRDQLKKSKQHTHTHRHTHTHTHTHCLKGRTFYWRNFCWKCFCGWDLKSFLVDTLLFLPHQLPTPCLQFLCTAAHPPLIYVIRRNFHPHLHIWIRVLLPLFSS